MLLRWRALVAGSDDIGGFVVNGVTDWTGCPLTRPPTSGFAAQIGQVLWRRRGHEVLVSLSCVEAETCRLIKSCSRTLDIKKLACEWLFGQLLVEVCADSSEAVDVSQQRDSGKTLHLEAGCQWFQSAIKKAGRSTG